MALFLETLGRAIAYSFLDMSLLLAGAALLLALTRNATPALRYWIGFAGLIAASVPFGAQFAPLFRTGAQQPQGSLVLPVWPAWLAAFWITGVLVLSVQTLGGWVLLWRRVRQAAPWDLPVWGELQRRMGTTAAIRLASRCDSPFTAGLWRPVVVVPAATIAGLSPEQLEAILLHELAHVRRHDYAFGLLLRALETLLFYHPGVWWLSGIIRAEREKACDDLALRAGAEREAFAGALLTLEELRASALTPAATSSPLAARIHRILRLKEPSMPFSPLVSLFAVLSLVVIAQPAGPYKMWLEQDVAYIIEPAEKAAFERLKNTEEQERFIEQFWKRRDPSPATGENEFKEEHYRRIRWANERYGWRTEQGRTYIVHGPPDEIEAHPPQKYEKWFYKDLRGIGKNVSFEFGERPKPQARADNAKVAAEQARQLREASIQFERQIEEHMRQLQDEDRQRMQQDIHRLRQETDQLAERARQQLQPTHPEYRRLEAEARRLEAELGNQQNQLKSFEQNRMEQEAFRLKQETEILQHQERQKP